MSLPNNKIIILAVSLAVIASAFILYTDSETTEAADVEYVMSASDLYGYGTYNIATNYLTLTSPIILSMPSGYNKITLDGDDLTIGNYLSSSPWIMIPGGVGNSYSIQNINFDIASADRPIIQIGSITGTAGKIELKNVKMEGDGLEWINAYCKELVIEECHLIGGLSGIIAMNKGDLTIKDSILDGFVNALKISTEGKVNINNSLVTIRTNFTHHGYGSAILMSSNSAELIIENTTFILDHDTYGISATYSPASRNASIKISDSFFTGGDGPMGSAIYLVGNLEGSLTVDRCLFNSLGSAMPPVYMETSMSFEFLNSTFSYNRTNDGEAIVTIKGMNGRIVNSTFFENFVRSSGGAVGCVSLIDSKVALVNNTFFNNNCSYDIPAYTTQTISLQISTNSSAIDIDLVNNIFATSAPGSLTTIIVAGTLNNEASIGTITGLRASGNLFVSFSTTAEELLLFSSNIYGSRIFVGCEIWDVSSSTELPMLPILPFSAADGTGAVNSLNPPRDQRGVARTGAPDVGSVTVIAAIFDTNGGYWEIDPYFTPYGYNFYDPYILTDFVGGEYRKLIAANYGDGIISLPWWAEPVNTGIASTLLGWNTVDPSTIPGGTQYLPDPSFVADQYGRMAGTFADRTTYYAAWGGGPAASFIPGNGYEPVVVLAGDDLRVVPPVFADKNGLIFIGWGKKDPEYGTLYAWDPNEQLLYGNIILYGMWEAIPSEELSFKVDFRNGDSTYSVWVLKGTPVSKPTDPQRIGYVFKGWYTASEGGTAWDFNTPILSNKTLYAQWEPTAVFDVTFDPCNGDPTVTVQVNLGQTVPVPKMPSMEGMKFIGWYTAAEKGSKWNFSTPIEGNLTLYAQYAPAGTGDGSEGGKEVDLKDGTVILAAVVAGLIASVGIAGVAAATGTAAVGLVGKATLAQALQGLSTEMFLEQSGEERNRRAVIFDPGNGKTPWSSSVIMGRLVDQPKNPKAPAGMMFSHWSESPNGPPFSFLTPITHVIHLYAVYVPKE